MPRPGGPKTPEPKNGANPWGALPPECKAAIIARLSNEDAALVAGVSSEFVGIVKKLRHAVHLLSLPPDLSPAALQGMVAAHTNLKSLSFRRCSLKLRQFLPILEAAAGGKPRGRSPQRQPRSLEVIDFRSCVHLSDTDINALCVHHSRLHDINLANCHSITDAALAALSKYEQSSPAVGPKEGDEEERELLVDHDHEDGECKQNASEEARGGIPDENRWSERYRRYILDEIENSVHPLPVLMDALRLAAGPQKELVRQGSTAAAAVGPNTTQADLLGGDGPILMQLDAAGPALMQIDSSGTKYLTYKVEATGDRRLVTRRKLAVPNVLGAHSELADVHSFGKLFASSRVVRVAGATQVTDQRLQLPGKKNPDRVVEAFTTTTDDVGVFVVADDDAGGPPAPDGRPELTNAKYSIDDFAEAEKFNRPSLRELASRPAVAVDHTNGGTLIDGAPKNVGNKESRELVVANKGGGDTPVPMGINFMHGAGGLEGVMSRKFKGLRALSVSGCGEITDKGVQALLKGPSKESLLSLDISKCRRVTSTGLRLPPKSALEILTANQMLSIVRLTLQLTRDVALQHLFLSSCPKLEELCVMSLNLQTVNASNCKRLVRVQLKCPNLTSLDISLNENFEAFGRFYCSGLLSLNAGGCRLLTPAALSTILDSASRLQELRIGGCDRLDRVDIPQLALLHLEVSGCLSLRRLYAYSKVLKVVEACGCKNLIEVHLYSSLLRRMLFSNCPLLHTLVIPLDAIKESVDAAVKSQAKTKKLPHEGFEISISGCNMPDSVRKNLARLTRQWKACFKS